MNSRWFLVQGSTSKRAMESEREKSLRKELKRIQDSKPKGDSLLKLIKGLQRLQASGPPALGARSPLRERSEVARVVEKYLISIGSPSFGVDSSSKSSGDVVSETIEGVTIFSNTDTKVFRIGYQPSLCRCSLCWETMPRKIWDSHKGSLACRDASCLDVVYLVPCPPGQPL